MKKTYEPMILFPNFLLILVPNGFGSDMESIRPQILIRIRKNENFRIRILKNLLRYHTVHQGTVLRILKPGIFV
jgi:hypothetical protein